MAIVIDLTKHENRKLLIQQIKGSENKGRRALSRRQVEIYNDNLYQHVWDRVARRFSQQTAQSAPLVSSINLSRRIVNQEASIYKEQPTREFEGLSEQQEQSIRELYEYMSIDAKMMQSNRSFKLQGQNHLMIVPCEGGLKIRVLRNHHVDKIDDDTDPELAAGYVISALETNDLSENVRSDANVGSGFKGRFDSSIDMKGNKVNEVIGDTDDNLLATQRFVVWTKELNFIMDGKGNILSDDIESPIPGVLPIIDISVEKDFAYWVKDGDPIGEFTIDFNTTLTDISNIVMMQGYAQSYLIAKDDIIPNNIQLGPNLILKLPMNNNDEPRPEFGFANPNSDIAGAINFAETLLSIFLSSRGVDPKSISGKADANKYGSGIERLLSMLEKFEASKSDYDTYNKVEKQIFEIVRAWYNASIGRSDLINPSFISGSIAESAEIEIKFAGPEMIQTEQDKIAVWRDKLDLGVASRIDILMDIRGVERDQALELAKQIDEESVMIGGMDAGKPEPSDENGFPGPGGDESRGPDGSQV